MFRRRELERGMSNREFFELVSERLPGALEAVVVLVREPDGVDLLLALDDMNIRGSQLWHTWQHCERDPTKVRTAIHQEREALARFLNTHKELVWMGMDVAVECFATILGRTPFNETAPGFKPHATWEEVPS